MFVIEISKLENITNTYDKCYSLYWYTKHFNLITPQKHH